MSGTTDFLPFCPTDTGSNLESQADYLADPTRVTGVVPGIASETQANKVWRQSSIIASTLAQYIANKLNANVPDDGNLPNLLAQFEAAFIPVAPTTQILTNTGTRTGTFFTVSSANATVGATYTNNTQVFTVLNTIVGGTQLFTSGIGIPLTSGTLTKSSGAGDASITFSVAQSLATYVTPSGPSPIYLKIKMLGGGGGGGVGSTAGTDSLFGSDLLVCGLGGNGGGGGNPGSNGGTGGLASIGSAIGIAISGANGEGSTYVNNAPVTQRGGSGGSSPLGGAGAGGGGGGASGVSASVNSGSGGGGSGTSSVISGSSSGGGAGGYVEAVISNPNNIYYYAVGIGGTAGTNAGAGGSGIIIVEEYYQ